MSEAREERVDKMEKILSNFSYKISGIEIDLKYLRERLDQYFEMHDKVIRQEERIKTADKKIESLEKYQDKMRNEITSMMVKVAGISAGVSFLMGIVLKT